MASHDSKDEERRWVNEEEREDVAHVNDEDDEEILVC